ncbi:PAS domain-containing sensor histidine kinase [Piscinibacter terrae]|uniref:histidine kinase n=1 Tax=Piscinibacter terrae TaxID=2496871 RepID=A0A3N7HUC4_9BURK|nr:PAS domain-containing sensor histidine kinase [Albitalea terrae]RQP25864.1 PAS domain S-box protein [Albitalea terrae]
MSSASTPRGLCADSLPPSTEPFRQLADSLTDVFWIYEPSTGSFLYVSPAYDRDWMGDSQELYRNSREWLIPVHDEDRQLLRDSIDQLAGSEGYVLEYRRTTPDGAQRWIEERTLPVRPQCGQLLHFAGVSQDITLRKAAELELLRSARCKDEFLAMLAHELRNPLQPIRWAAALLSRQHLDGPVAEKQAAAIIERQVGHLTRLVDDLMDVSRVTHEKSRLRPELICLGDVIEAAIETHRFLAESMRVHLRVTMPGDVWVRGDAVRLTQVFSNLLHNAVKFSPAGGIVDLCVHCGEGTQQVSIRVRDEGSGIRPDMIDSIFDLFTQEEPSHGRSNGGLGIGLSVVRNLVELHGGVVSAHSDGMDKGSEFVVTLARAASPAAQVISSKTAPTDVGAVADRRAPGRASSCVHQPRQTHHAR